MPEESAFNRLLQFKRLAEKTIEEASKPELAEALRILAIQLAHYQRKFGAMPLAETAAVLADSPTAAERAKMLADGLENLAAVISMVREDNEEATSSMH